MANWSKEIENCREKKMWKLELHFSEFKFYIRVVIHKFNKEKLYFQWAKNPDKTLLKPKRRKNF